MSFDIVVEPTVKTPKMGKPRRGRGFSLAETKEAGLGVKEARLMGLIIDKRRKTTHPENVEMLKQYIKDFEKLVDEILTVPEEPKAKAKTKAKPSVSPEKVIAELSSLRAVKKAEAESLFEAGIKSISDLAYCDIAKTAKKTGIDEERITLMVKAALKKV